jgi:DNA polymerase III subunit beta
MNFSIELADIRIAIEKLMPAIPPKSTLPVLEHIYASLSGSELKLVSTDQDLTIEHSCSVGGAGDGKVLLPARKISEITKALGSSGVIGFEIDDASFDIAIKTKTGKFHMKGLNPEEYLDLPELRESSKPEHDGENFTHESSTSSNVAFFAKSDISKICLKTFFAVSNDEFRPAMTGVLFQFRKEYVNAVATDSYRLAKAVTKSENASFPDDIDIILPKKIVEILKSAENDVLLSFLENGSKLTHIRFDIASTVYISRIIDEKFPPYEAVIPEDNDKSLIVDKSELLKAIKLVSIFSSNISKQIRVAVSSGQMIVKGQDDDSGSDAKETITCEYDGEELEIGFNFKYLEDAVSNIDPTENNTVKFTFSESTRPALVMADKVDDDKNIENDVLMLIMPVRIS